MREIKIYELTDLIPLITIYGEIVQKKNPKPIATFSIPDDEDNSNSNELNTVENDSAEDSIHWLIENQLLGELGEQIALKYFQTKYNEVIYTAHNAYIGYDLKVILDSRNYLGVEVKTSLNNWGFHISYNELQQAAKLRDSSRLFFIHLEIKDNFLQVAKGYFLVNPIDYFEIDFDKITAPNIHEKATVKPNKFYFELNSSYIKNCSIIVDLMPFIKNEDIEFLIR